MIYQAVKRFKTTMLRSDLCDSSDVYIVVKGKTTVEGTVPNNQTDKYLAFKNNTPFRSCISKISNTFIDSTEDLDIAMSLYNLLEYSNKYSMTSESVWNYYRDQVNDNSNEINADNFLINVI